MTDLLTAAHDAAKLARRHGADEAAISVSRSRGVDIEWRDGRVERVQERTRRSLSVEVYVDGRYSASSTNDLRPEAIDAFIAEAVQNTRLLEPDPHRGLPDPSRYAGRADIDLDLADPKWHDVSGEDRRALAAELEALARDGDDDLPIVSVASSVGDSHGRSARVHTNGFEGVREATTTGYSVMITVKDQDDRRPMGWSYSYCRHREDLDAPEAIARVARQKARDQLGAGRIKTGRYRVVVENRALPRLLGAFLGPLSGPALQQRRSLWEGKLGEQIASPLLTLHDDPHRPRGLAATLWDGDGFATHRRPLIEAGVLRTYLIDQYYARKMGTEPTGGSTHDLDWALGDKGLDALIASVGDGVFIDRFLGGNSNSTSGEYSFGCAGRMIRDGKLAEPVAEMNLAGNLADLMKQLEALGDDPDKNRSSRCPSAVFDGLQLGGE
ncbi:MAG: TldD/PmbA family protein [Myxococcales bacterium]|nr:TldD/PmbA family protein [Myxococcales bacterium]